MPNDDSLEIEEYAEQTQAFTWLFLTLSRTDKSDAELFLYPINKLKNELGPLGVLTVYSSLALIIQGRLDLDDFSSTAAPVEMFSRFAIGDQLLTPGELEDDPKHKNLAKLTYFIGHVAANDHQEAMNLLDDLFTERPHHPGTDHPCCCDILEFTTLLAALALQRMP